MNVQRCITIALVLGSVGLSAAFLGRAAFWTMYPEAVEIPVPEAKAPARPAPAAQKAAPSFDLRQMEALNLFGTRVSAQAPLPGSEEAGVEISEDEAGALPVSRRGFDLLGTIVQADGRSRAVISAGKEEKTYLEGEKVKDWTLVKVLRRVVILEKDGLRERLPFKEESKRAARSSAGSKGEKSHDSIALSKSRIMAIMSDPAALSADMTALSSHSDKGRSGLLVGKIASGGLLDMLELQEGDLLLRASNKRITRLNDLAELAAELNASQSMPLELEIMRGGTVTLIRYKLD